MPHSGDTPAARLYWSCVFQLSLHKNVYAFVRTLGSILQWSRDGHCTRGWALSTCQKSNHIR